MSGLTNADTEHLEPELMAETLPADVTTTQGTLPTTKVYHNMFVKQIDGTQAWKLEVARTTSQYAHFWNPRDVSDSDYVTS